MTFRPADGHSGSGRSTSPYLTRPVRLAPLDEDDAESPGPPGPHRIGPIQATLDRWPRSGPGPPGRPIRPASTSQPVRPPCRGPPPARPDIRPARRLARTSGARTYGLPGHGVPPTFSSAVNSSGQDRLKALPTAWSFLIDNTHDTPPGLAAPSMTGPRLARRRHPLSPSRVHAPSVPCHGRVTAASAAVERPRDAAADAHTRHRSWSVTNEPGPLSPSRPESAPRSSRLHRSGSRTGAGDRYRLISRSLTLRRIHVPVRPGPPPHSIPRPW